MQDKIKQLESSKRIPITDKAFSVYILYLGDEIVYVGSSELIKYRVQQHIVSDKKIDSYSFIDVDTEQEMYELEFRLISKYQPIYNLSAGHPKSGFLSADSLKRRYSLNKAIVKKKAREGKIEFLVSIKGIYYNVNQMDRLMGYIL